MCLQRKKGKEGEQWRSKKVCRFEKKKRHDHRKFHGQWNAVLSDSKKDEMRESPDGFLQEIALNRENRKRFMSQLVYIVDIARHLSENSHV